MCFKKNLIITPLTVDIRNLPYTPESFRSVWTLYVVHSVQKYRKNLQNSLFIQLRSIFINFVVLRDVSQNVKAVSLSTDIILGYFTISLNLFTKLYVFLFMLSSWHLCKAVAYFIEIFLNHFEIFLLCIYRIFNLSINVLGVSILSSWIICMNRAIGVPPETFYYMTW